MTIYCVDVFIYNINTKLDDIVCVEKLTQEHTVYLANLLSGETLKLVRLLIESLSRRITSRQRRSAFGRRLWALTMAELSRNNTAPFRLAVGAKLWGCLRSFEDVLF